jgi:hypothetical protein
MYWPNQTLLVKTLTRDELAKSKKNYKRRKKEAGKKLLIIDGIGKHKQRPIADTVCFFLLHQQLYYFSKQMNNDLSFRGFSWFSNMKITILTHAFYYQPYRLPVEITLCLFMFCRL